MTAIYTPLSVEGYELCQPVNKDDFENINVLLNGEVRREGWKPITMRMIREDDGRKFLESDSPWLGAHALIFGPRAVQALSHLLQQFGELLPLACGRDEVWIYNPTRVLEALDESASSVVRFGNGRIMRINRYVFRADRIQDVHIFKIPNLRVSPTFVSQHFVDVWLSAGLRGLEFKRIWMPVRTSAV